MSQVINNPQQNRFESSEDGLTAVGDYFLSGETIVVTHIIVPQQLRGRGVASSIAAEIVAHARRENMTIRPLCSFMVAYMERHPEHNDLLV